ncbi:hypothetical protein [Thauera humireducens]|uniref:hypothetical protein n=1 Tax=Thauera humireducens TaxID=1134435 RepID=UPI00311E5466
MRNLFWFGNYNAQEPMHVLALARAAGITSRGSAITTTSPSISHMPPLQTGSKAEPYARPIEPLCRHRYAEAPAGWRSRTRNRASSSSFT